MNLTRFALKNLGRHPIRTALKALALGLAAASLVVWGSLTRGFTESLRASATSLELGELQLHHESYLTSQSPYDLLRDEDALLAQLRAAGYEAAPRAYGSVLAASGELSAGALLRGVDPAAEARSLAIADHLQTGTWISPATPKGVVIGKSLARKLRISPGSELVVLGQAMDGSLTSEVLVVTGVLKAVSKELDDRAVYLPLATFRELFQLPGGIHEIAVVGRERALTDTDRARIETLTAGRPGTQAKTWRELKPLLARMLALLSVTVYFTMGFTYVALGGLILNTVFMTVYDRMREYGVMKAVGMLPSEVRFLILAEAAWLGLLAAGFAAVLGIPAARFLEANGLDLSSRMSNASFAGVHLEPLVRADLGFVQVLVPLAALLILTPLFALYPAAEAARLSPQEALQKS